MHIDKWELIFFIELLLCEWQQGFNQLTLPTSVLYKLIVQTTFSSYLSTAWLTNFQKLYSLLRLREVTNIWRCQKVLDSAGSHPSHNRTINGSDKRKDISQRFACYSAGTSEIKCRFRHSNLFDLCYCFHHSLLGFLRLHASTHGQRAVPDSIRTTSSLVLETRRSSLHSSDDPHVKQFTSTLPFSVLFICIIILLVLSCSTDNFPWCDDATWL